MRYVHYTTAFRSQVGFAVAKVALGRDFSEYGWLRHYATSRKVAGSIPDEVIGFFN
jgi:hypothetical protein